MKDIDFKLIILLESLNVHCTHYCGDEEPCKKVGDHLACNCDGAIQACDLLEYSREAQEKWGDIIKR